MMNRAAVRKFILDDVPAMASSSGTRSGSSIPLDMILHSLVRSLTQLIQCLLLVRRILSLLAILPQFLPRSRLCLHFTRGFVWRKLQPRAPLQVTLLIWFFPAPALTPHLDPRSGVFNMSCTIHRSDVEALLSKSVLGLGSFILAQNSTTSATVTAMMEKHTTLLKEFEARSRSLLEMCSELNALRRKY
ncbi:hypothetical protein Salat_1139300 [Sesamum alatum]|uniref:Uncharacterized protein n=1 Tax=Sesamum alatum TaxID=300844 RepID=A0AAE1YE67_9LAMI|nr:hypothetical protein Salat_1139300 [Sesamum alatum]